MALDRAELLIKYMAWQTDCRILLLETGSSLLLAMAMALDRAELLIKYTDSDSHTFTMALQPSSLLNKYMADRQIDSLGPVHPNPNIVSRRRKERTSKSLQSLLIPKKVI